MPYRNDIIEELQEEIQNGKGCIVFDFGCCLPPIDADWIFRFSFGKEIIGEEVAPSQKLNHRYPNKNYITISKKNGRKISKIGYPFYVDLQDNDINTNAWCLKIEVGFKIGVGFRVDEYILTLFFPIKLHLTEENPVCGLTFHYFFEKGDFIFYTRKCGENGIEEHRYGDDIFGTKDVQPLSEPTQADENTLVYYDDIQPRACKLEELWMI